MVLSYSKQLKTHTTNIFFSGRTKIRLTPQNTTPISFKLHQISYYLITKMKKHKTWLICYWTSWPRTPITCLAIVTQVTTEESHAKHICIPELIRSRLGTSVHSIECLVLYNKRPSQVSRRPGLVTRHDRRTWYFTENLTINIYSSLIVTIRYYSSLFATIRHYLRLFAVFGDYSGFITSQVSGIKTENPNAPSLRGGPLNRRRMRNQRERLFISCTEPGVIDA